MKLLEIPLQIIERYRPMHRDNLVFPRLVYLQVAETDDKGMRHKQVISIAVVMASQRWHFVRGCPSRA